MRVVFIDQNKWIDLARAANGLPEGESYVDTYGKLLAAVGANKIVFPLTVSHIVETAKRNDPDSRMAVARVQAKLSKGMVYRSRKARLLVEMRNSLHRIFSEPEMQLPVNWAIVPGFMQAFEQFDALIASSKEAAQSALINEYLEPESQYIHYMQNQDDARRRLATAAFSSGSAALLANIDERRAIMTGSSVDLRYRAYCARLFLDHQGYVAHVLEVIGHTVEQVKALGDRALLDFIFGVPTLNVEAEIAARLEIRQGALKENHIRDMYSFCTAIPHSRTLVAERDFISLSQQAKLDAKYGVKLCTSLDELAAECG
jgi:hypothetical protein